MLSFISFRIADAVDILIVAYLLYQVYRFTKDSVAVNIVVAIVGLFVFWLLVRAFNMELTGAILRQVFSIGTIALVVLFQPELRRFLMNLGATYRSRSWFRKLNRFFIAGSSAQVSVKVRSIVLACSHMSASKTGALIVITRVASLQAYSETGDVLNANTSSRLLENIFFKNSPLHDGAVIITGDQIHAARCILPVSDNRSLPANLGLRHRAALGITENTDALAIIVSEETGHISVADRGVVYENITVEELTQRLENLSAKD